MLEQLQPDKGLFMVFTRMLKQLWTKRHDLADAKVKAMTAELKAVEDKISVAVDKLLEIRVPQAVAQLEERIQQLDLKKAALKEKIASSAPPEGRLDETVRTSLAFLGNPWNLWASGNFEARKLVLKLALVDRLEYVRKVGLRTPNLALPFKVLGDFFECEKEMAHPRRFERPAFAFGERS